MTMNDENECVVCKDFRKTHELCPNCGNMYYGIYNLNKVESGKPREFWISEACELPPPVPFVDKDVGDYIVETSIKPQTERPNWTHVIEKSAFDSLKEENARLKAEIAKFRLALNKVTSCNSWSVDDVKTAKEALAGGQDGKD